MCRLAALALTCLAIGAGLYGYQVQKVYGHQSGYCGHTTKYWTFYQDGQHPLNYRMIFQYSNGIQNSHYHQYRTQLWGKPLPGIWNYVDQHYRHCPEPV